MIIYGSKMYFKENVVKSMGVCEHCGRYSQQLSYRGRKFGHLYFIPLVPMAPRSQVLNECSNCNMGSHIPLDQLESILEDIRDNFKTWIGHVQDGKNEIHLEGEPVNVGILLHDLLENLYLLQEVESAGSIVSVLKSQEMHSEAELVSARWHELQGDLSRAIASYKTAHEHSPEEIRILYNVGRLQRLQGNNPQALLTFAKCLELEPESLVVLLEIAGIHEGAKDFPRIVESYDRIYDLCPQLVDDKGMKKMYKKACKKSGVQGKYL